jgi:hypothetical protein
MRLAVRLAAALLAPLLCLGAGPVPEAVPAPAVSQSGTAQIQLLANPDADVRTGVNSFFLGPGATENLYLLKDTRCMSLFGAKNLGSFGMLWGNDKGLVTIPADKIAILWMVENEPSGYRQRRMCENAAEFIPEGGHAYDVRQATTSTSCRLSVIDRATGFPPPTYRPFSPKVFCQSKK